MKLALVGASAFSAATVVATALLAATAQATIERAIHMTTAGNSAEIGHHARWNANCDAAPAPRVTLEQPPGHGIVCVSPGPIQPVISRSGAALNCVGKTVQGIHVVYSPHAAFAGVDTLRYGLDAPEGHVSRDVSITVQGKGQTTLTPTSSSSSDVQGPGPMPECPRPVS